MGASREAAMEGGVGAGHLGIFLLRDIPGGAVVWVRDMGAVDTNSAEVRESACGFYVPGKKVKIKEAEGRVVVEGGIKQSTSVI